ncbi:MAG: transketolase [Candidatus Nomurabacteria bacterium]|jgi:transketolase|nr:transketolase [Candidatus Nomurabacteria bacterium]
MSQTILQIEQHARRMRREVIRMIALAGSGHPASSLGLCDVFATLYFEVLRYNPRRADDPERDILVLSAGHAVPAQYAALAEAGLIPEAELATLRQFGSRLQGHPEREKLAWLETTSGPLGSGLSEAAGMAWAIDKKRFVYCIMGDGELDEGNIWEGAMFASKYSLGNLIGIVDRNGIQLDGDTENIMPLEDLRAKWEAFGWQVLEIDGNNVQSFIEACAAARAETERPSLILAHTVPGKGVSFMENDYRWHGQAPDEAQVRKALEGLK